MTRTTKSHLPAEWKGAERSEEETEVRGGDGSGTGGGGECARGKEKRDLCGATGVDGTGVGGVSGDGVNVGRGGATGGNKGFITARITLNFVAAPGHTAPPPQPVEYRMDMSSRQGSQEIAVFLGEVNYNDAGGTT